jgi:hypothetical protein
MAIQNQEIGWSNESKLLRYILKQLDKMYCLICELVESLAGATDEKVKYDANDPTAGYLVDKVVAGEGIILSEGTGVDENKLVITATCECIEYLIVSQEEPTNPTDGLLWYKPDLCLTTTTTTVEPIVTTTTTTTAEPIEPFLKFTFTEGNAPVDLSTKLTFNAPFVYGDLTQVDGTDTITLTGSALAEITEINVTEFNVLEIEGLVFCTSGPYLDCDSNSLTELPALPDTLTYLYCNYNSLTELPTLPDTLTSLYCSNNSLTELPALPDTLEYLYCFNNLLTSAEMDTIAVELDTAGLSNGYYVWSPQTNLQEPNQTAVAYLSLIAKGWLFVD